MPPAKNWSMPNLIGDGAEVLAEEFRLLPDLIGSSELFGERFAAGKPTKQKESDLEEGHSSSDLFGADS